VKKAFTLIELLIVVAIIAILAAIAVPNFLEAQTRAKVARVMSDMRTYATGLEAYAVDYNKYPPYHYTGYTNPYVPQDEFFVGGGTMSGSTPNSGWEPNGIAGYTSVWLITTPIAYLTSMPVDSFHPALPSDPIHTHSFVYVNWDYGSVVGAVPVLTAQQQIDLTGTWRMISAGPDKYRGPAPGQLSINGISVFYTRYDPSNGTVSLGNILRNQKDPTGATGKS
jgi:prepilin-type N-terminal cleavage/methylation domain-containing protein